MSEALWRIPVREFMQNSAQNRAAHYRQQASELRELAESQISERVRGELLDLAGKYEALASLVSAS